MALANASLQSLIELPADARQQTLSQLSERDALTLLYDWPFWARPNQLPPQGDWRVWLLLAGRGFGKSRTGAEWVREQVESGRSRRIALVAPTAADVRDVMIEGESGLLAICPPWNMPVYESSKRRLTWPNGAIATTYSAEEPDRLRGPQHDAAWCDEVAAWRYPETWDMLMFGLRLGVDPRCVVTTTPKPIPIIRNLLKSPTTAITRGSTYENRANLAEAFFEQIVAQYEGTRLGRQELYAEVLDDVEGALWTRALIDQHRVKVAPELKRIVVAIDPAITASDDSDETGIVVAGLGVDNHGYALDDLSLRASPDGWARRAVEAYHARKADRIVAEVNQGGDMVEYTIRTVDPRASIKKVHAARGKQTRAEPIVALYEQGRIHHVGVLPQLEEQMCNWVPGMDSPDRMDAAVWAFTELMLGQRSMPPVRKPRGW